MQFLLYGRTDMRMLRHETMSSFDFHAHSDGSEPLEVTDRVPSIEFELVDLEELDDLEPLPIGRAADGTRTRLPAIDAESQLEQPSRAWLAKLAAVSEGSTSAAPPPLPSARPRATLPPPRRSAPNLPIVVEAAPAIGSRPTSMPPPIPPPPMPVPAPSVIVEAAVQSAPSAPSEARAMPPLPPIPPIPATPVVPSVPVVAPPVLPAIPTPAHGELAAALEPSEQIVLFDGWAAQPAAPAVIVPESPTLSARLNKYAAAAKVHWAQPKVRNGVAIAATGLVMLVAYLCLRGGNDHTPTPAPAASVATSAASVPTEPTIQSLAAPAAPKQAPAPAALPAPAVEAQPTAPAPAAPASAPAAAAPAVPAAPAPAAHVATSVSSPVASAPTHATTRPAQPQPAPKRVATASPVSSSPAPSSSGRGVLQISTKPPCEIVVDGKPMHLTTPQRSLVLPAGSHQLTLINSQQKIKKTVPVTISAQHPTKLIQDFMKKG